MPLPFARLASAAFQYYVVAQLTKGGVVARWRIKRIVGAVLLLFSMAVIGIVGVVLLISALFFQLADLNQYVAAAAIAGAVSVLISILALVQALRLFR